MLCGMRVPVLRPVSSRRLYDAGRAAPRAAASQALTKVHTPGVKTIAELCAFLKIPAVKTVKAVVVLRAGHEGQVSAQDIIDWCRDNMAVYKAPRIVQFVTTLPKSGSGKVMWRALQEAELS